MKKALLFILFIALTGKGFAQFSADLAGYPLVTTGWTIGGSATVVDSTIQLTPPAGGQSGYVYYNTPVDLTSCGQFTVDFDFRVIVSPTSTVADGIAFWYISNPPSGFATGGGVGLPANPNGLIMIMDTYDNAAPVNVPLETLLGYPGTVPGYIEGSPTGVLAPVVGSQFFITDGTWHHCKITYNTGSINVYFNYSAVASLTGTYPMSISGYFGFSSSTGAAYSTQSVKSVHITAAGTSAPPTVTSPITYCQNAPATALTATVSPGGTTSWFSTDTGTVVALPGAPVPNTSTVGTKWYFVRQGSGICISNPDSIEVIVVAPPAAPVISGVNSYCQGAAFVPFTVTGATGSLMWYTVPTGGLGSSTPLSVPTGVAGYYDVWVSQVVSGCEGPRDSIRVHVITTPPIPTVTGTTSYCQYIGPYVPVVPVTTPSGTARWYTSPTGGTPLSAEPPVDINTPGTNTFYLSQIDSTCESNRGTVTINVNPKPAPPTYTQPVYCQFDVAIPMSATGTNIVWYGTGVTPGYITAPTPATALPGTFNYYATQTSSFGCVSDSATFPVVIKPQPQPPAVTPLSYCQHSPAAPLTAVGTSLQWFNLPTGGTALGAAPTPSTAAVGTLLWYVTQTVNGCESNRATLPVTIIYKPNFTIATEHPFVCQHDSLTLSFSSPDSVPLTYQWTVPNGATLVNGTDDHQPSIMVQFDSANQLNVVHLIATGLDGKCTTDTFVQIKVVELPSAQAYSKPNVCVGDTTALALTFRSPTASDFKWQIDNVALFSSKALTMISASSNHGGEYLVSWNDSGRHIIQLTTLTAEGCKSPPTYDTIDAHAKPDATFMIHTRNGNLCIEDSVQFMANTVDYSNSYMWAPAHSFDNNNKPAIWGKVEEEKSMITLTVTNPFGCTGIYSQQIDPSSCCKVFFPNAFTPGDALHNNRFRPVYAGFHTFHIFRLSNRWGQTVFESASNVPEWDGNYNGIPQDVGTYYYYIKYDCGGKVIEQKGDVTLVR